MPEVKISTDIIVGFPGETRKQFNNTVKFFKEIKFDKAYIARYSPRPGTPAAGMDLQTPEPVKDERLARLQALLAEQAQAFNVRLVGCTLPVLFTRKGKRPGQALGYSPYMQPVHVDAAPQLIGALSDVRIAGATATSLTGVLTSQAMARGTPA